MNCRFNRIACAVIIFAGILSGCTSSAGKPDYYSLEWPVTEAEYLASLPDDVYPESGSRLPIVDRNILDEAGKAFYDSRRAPGSPSRGGIRGPGSVRLHGSPGGLENTLVDMRTQELVRLVVSREHNQPFEWTLHEPVALQHGLEPYIIDVIRYRRSLDGVPEKEASLIQWGRELFQNHHVSSETFARLMRNITYRDLIDLCAFMGAYTNTSILLNTINAHLPYDREPLLPME